MTEVDGFRFVTQLNTQVRTLVTLSQMVKIIGSKQLPIPILQNTLQSWSAKEEEKSSTYKNHRGKITKNNGKPTTAFKPYLQFITSLGLITTVGNFVTCSRTGKLLNQFANYPKQTDSQLNTAEKLFYLINLFNYDADALILTLELLQDFEHPVSQKKILEKFEVKLKERLLLKQKYATGPTKLDIQERYKRVHYEWKKTLNYAKHIIPPRLEWLEDLNITKQQKKGYQLTAKGQRFYKTLFTLANSNSQDINQTWLQTKAMAAFSTLVLPTTNLIYWTDLSITEQNNLLTPILPKAFALFDSEGAWRASFNATAWFVIINLSSKQNVIIEQQDLETALKSSIIINEKKFSVRSAARANEKYITMNLV